MTDRDRQAERVAELLAKTADEHLRAAAYAATDDREPLESVRQDRVQTQLLWSIAKRHRDDD